MIFQIFRQKNMVNELPEDMQVNTMYPSLLSQARKTSLETRKSL